MKEKSGGSQRLRMTCTWQFSHAEFHGFLSQYMGEFATTSLLTYRQSICMQNCMTKDALWCPGDVLLQGTGGVRNNPTTLT